jgi:hypothetical protein
LKYHFSEKDPDMKKLANDNNTRNVAMLSRLAGMLDCSLAGYLLNARPWVRRPHLLLGAVARRLATEHEYYAGEIVRLLHARGHNVNSHTYPMEFTYYNDLSLEHLAPRLLDHQRRLINFTDALSTELSGDYEAKRILKKLLASLRKYGSLLQELLSPQRLAARTSEDDTAVINAVARAPDRTGRKTRSRGSLTAA